VYILFSYHGLWLIIGFVQYCRHGINFSIPVLLAIYFNGWNIHSEIHMIFTFIHFQSSNESTPVMKKSRPKQQVQNLNVEILASRNQVSHYKMKNDIMVQLQM
jgi:hypothetical protein